MAVAFTQVIPVLRIFDEAKAREFYVGYLGFEVDWEHRYEDNAPLYMQVSRGGLVLHLSEHYGDAMPGSCVYVTMSGIEQFHREIHARNYKYLKPGIGPGPGDGLCIDLIDPFGNRLRLNERGVGRTGKA